MQGALWVKKWSVVIVVVYGWVRQFVVFLTEFYHYVQVGSGGERASNGKTFLTTMFG